MSSTLLERAILDLNDIAVRNDIVTDSIKKKFESIRKTDYKDNIYLQIEVNNYLKKVRWLLDDSKLIHEKIKVGIEYLKQRPNLIDKKMCDLVILSCEQSQKDIQARKTKIYEAFEKAKLNAINKHLIESTEKSLSSIEDSAKVTRFELFNEIAVLNKLSKKASADEAKIINELMDKLSICTRTINKSLHQADSNIDFLKSQEEVKEDAGKHIVFTANYNLSSVIKEQSSLHKYYLEELKESLNNKKPSILERIFNPVYKFFTGKTLQESKPLYQFLDNKIKEDVVKVEKLESIKLDRRDVIKPDRPAKIQKRNMIESSTKFTEIKDKKSATLAEVHQHYAPKV